jgi:hypothetical protein
VFSKNTSFNTILTDPIAISFFRNDFRTFLRKFVYANKATDVLSNEHSRSFSDILDLLFLLLFKFASVSIETIVEASFVCFSYFCLVIVVE